MKFNKWFKLKEEEEHPDWDKMNPDSALHVFGDAKKFTAFVWVYDKNSKQSLLYCQPGNVYHGEGMSSYQQSKLKKVAIFQNRDAVVCFGRFGETKNGGFVTVWHYEGEEPITHFDKDLQKELNRGYQQPNTEDMKIFIKGLLGQVPIKVIGKSPAKLPITPDYKFIVDGKVQNVREFVGDQASAQKEDPTCTAMQLNINGRNVPLYQAQASLHMVKGNELSLIKGAFCSQYKFMKSNPQTQHCKVQHRQLDDLAAKINCVDDKELWQKSLEAGKFNYRQELKNIFPNPKKIDRLFRTQKDIDDAWDFLQGENYSFKNWLFKFGN